MSTSEEPTLADMRARFDDIVESLRPDVPPMPAIAVEQTVQTVPVDSIAATFVAYTLSLREESGPSNVAFFTVTGGQHLISSAQTAFLLLAQMSNDLPTCAGAAEVLQRFRETLHPDQAAKLAVAVELLDDLIRAVEASIEHGPNTVGDFPVEVTWMYLGNDLPAVVGELAALFTAMCRFVVVFSSLATGMRLSAEHLETAVSQLLSHVYTTARSAH